MTSTTIGQLLIDEALPEGMRGVPRTLDKKGMSSLLKELAEKYPDQYREVSHKLLKIGGEAAYYSGGYSYGAEHLAPARAALKYRRLIEAETGKILSDPNLTDEEQDAAINKLVAGHDEAMTREIYEESLAEKNPLALQVQSGAKGSPTNLRSLRGGDLAYVDQRGRPIPIPVLRSYSEGLSPAEYFAGTFGARKGVVDLKLSTADVGYAAKRLAQAAHRLVVTARDHDQPIDHESPTGLPVPTDDVGNEGAYLAAPAGPYQRNTMLTPRVLSDLRARGIDHLLVRSPVVGGPPDGGLYAYDAGARERGNLAPVGEYVGLGASQSLSEPISQGAISSKHKGGVASSETTSGGFKLLDQLISIPKTFPGGATHASIDGRINRIEPAPQGGHFIHVNDEVHYVPHERAVTAKVGDQVEAGDTLSDGIANPAEFVKHKGIGEGRRRFLETFRQAAVDSGVHVDRRNVEVVTRGLIDHVRLHDEVAGHLPDDVVSYQALESGYEPREGHRTVAPSAAVGMYLEKPVLHYTIGTKVRPSMLESLGRYKVGRLTVHADPPPFEPVMVRSHDVLASDPDWMTQMLGSNLEKHLLRGAHRGATSDRAGTSFVPALAEGKHFGLEGLTKGFDAKTLGG